MTGGTEKKHNWEFLWMGKPFDLTKTSSARMELRDAA